MLRAYGSKFPIKLNGIAISPRIRDKFQLLTLGTRNLDLSLSYGFIVKAHGGDLKVATNKGQ